MSIQNFNQQLQNSNGNNLTFPAGTDMSLLAVGDTISQTAGYDNGRTNWQALLSASPKNNAPLAFDGDSSTFAYGAAGSIMNFTFPSEVTGKVEVRGTGQIAMFEEGNGAAVAILNDNSGSALRNLDYTGRVKSFTILSGYRWQLASVSLDGQYLLNDTELTVTTTARITAINGTTITVDGGTWVNGVEITGPSKRVPLIQTSDAFVINNLGTSYRILADRLKSGLNAKKTWTATQMGTSGEFHGVAFGNNRFVACSYSTANFFMWSDDGINWYNGSGPEKPWYDITYGDNKYVCVGSAAVAYSIDGKSWTQVGSIGNSYLAVAEGNGNWVAVGTTGSHLASSDGVNWTETTTGQLTNGASYQDIVYGDGKFVAVASNGNNRIVYTTDNGSSWNNITAPTGVANDWMGVAYGNGRYVAVSRNNSNCVMWSTDAINWNVVTPPQQLGWQAITFGGGQFVAVGQDGTGGVMSSPDGETWTMEKAATDSMWVAVTYGNNKYVAVAQTGSAERGMYQEVVAPLSGEMVVSRSNVSYRVDINNIREKLQNSDFLLVNRGGTNYKVSGDDFRNDLLGVIPEIFSVKTYTGNGGTPQSIVNGIDLAGGGGLVWIKARTTGTENVLTDTVRGPNKYISSNTVNTEITPAASDGLTSFNSDGFTVGGVSPPVNYTQGYVSWTFKKSPGFFDVVTYTGNSDQARAIPHSLGSKPGLMFVKNLSTGSNWITYHQYFGAEWYNQLNLRDQWGKATTWWRDTEPTSSEFTVGQAINTNTPGDEFVAYLWADNPGIIKCGNWIGDGSFSQEVFTGFEAQFVMAKAELASDWEIWDTTRGMKASNAKRLYWSQDYSESNTTSNNIYSTPNGFMLNNNWNVSGRKYVYMAIAAPF